MKYHSISCAARPYAPCTCDDLPSALLIVERELNEQTREAERRAAKLPEPARSFRRRDGVLPIAEATDVVAQARAHHSR